MAVMRYPESNAPSTVPWTSAPIYIHYIKTIIFKLLNIYIYKSLIDCQNCGEFISLRKHLTKWGDPHGRSNGLGSTGTNGSWRLIQSFVHSEFRKGSPFCVAALWGLLAISLSWCDLIGMNRCAAERVEPLGDTDNLRRLFGSWSDCEGEERWEMVRECSSCSFSISDAFVIVSPVLLIFALMLS